MEIQFNGTLQEFQLLFRAAFEPPKSLVQVVRDMTYDTSKTPVSDIPKLKEVEPFKTYMAPAETMYKPCRQKYGSITLLVREYLADLFIAKQDIDRRALLEELKDYGAQSTISNILHKWISQNPQQRYYTHTTGTPVGSGRVNVVYKHSGVTYVPPGEPRPTDWPLKGASQGAGLLQSRAMRAKESGENYLAKKADESCTESSTY